MNAHESAPDRLPLRDEAGDARGGQPATAPGEWRRDGEDPRRPGEVPAGSSRYQDPGAVAGWGLLHMPDYPSMPDYPPPADGGGEGGSRASGPLWPDHSSMPGDPWMPDYPSMPDYPPRPSAPPASDYPASDYPPNGYPAGPRFRPQPHFPAGAAGHLPGHGAGGLDDDDSPRHGVGGYADPGWADRGRVDGEWAAGEDGPPRYPGEDGPGGYQAVAYDPAAYEPRPAFPLNGYPEPGFGPSGDDAREGWGPAPGGGAGIETAFEGAVSHDEYGGYSPPPPLPPAQDTPPTAELATPPAMEAVLGGRRLAGLAGPAAPAPASFPPGELLAARDPALPAGGALPRDSATSQAAAALGQDAARWAVLAYLTVPIFGFVLPLAAYLRGLQQSPWLRSHAAQALNVWLTGALYELSALVVGTMLALDALQVALTTMLPVVALLWLAKIGFLVRAAAAASRGDRYTVPRWLCSTIFH